MPVPPPAPQSIAGLVLAGGLSARLGGGIKGLRPLADRPMIAHVIERIAPQVGALAVNANASGCEFLGLPVLPDPVPGNPGPLAGILAGLEWAALQTGTTHLSTVPADAPFLPADLVARLAGAADPEFPVLARTGDGVQSVIGLWPLSLAPRLAGWLRSGASRKVLDWASDCGAGFCDFPASDTSPDPFFNVNTPDDLALAEAWLCRR